MPTIYVPRFWRFKITNFDVAFWELWRRKKRAVFSWRQSYIINNTNVLSQNKGPVPLYEFSFDLLSR